MIRVVGMAFVIAQMCSVAQARQEPKFVRICRPAGIEKLQSRAEALDAKFDPSQVQVCGIDARPFNPSKYVWFCADVTLPDGTQSHLSTLTQWSSFEPKSCL